MGIKSIFCVHEWQYPFDQYKATYNNGITVHYQSCVKCGKTRMQLYDMLGRKLK